ncbi:MAG: hypothetical protein GYB66_01525 [Chloroflexi bacterium]|nr:hypothetical protein [Chloroflexota bacterium]
MIIRRRMPRIAARRNTPGRIGLRAMHTNLKHVQRMVISRLPQSLGAISEAGASLDQPQDAFQNFSAPGGPTAGFPAPSTPQASSLQRLPSDIGDIRRYPVPPVISGSSGDTSDITSSPHMPKDLQSIIDRHKARGDVREDSSYSDYVEQQRLKHQREKEELLRSRTIQPRPKNVRYEPEVQRSASSSQKPPTSETVSSGVELPEMPPPKSNRVRTSFEYVNVSSPDRQSQSDQSAQEYTSADSEEDLPDALPGTYTMDDETYDQPTDPYSGITNPDLSAAIQRAEQIEPSGDDAAWQQTDPDYGAEYQDSLPDDPKATTAPPHEQPATPAAQTDMDSAAAIQRAEWSGTSHDAGSDQPADLENADTLIDFRLDAPKTTTASSNEAPSPTEPPKHSNADIAAAIQRAERIEPRDSAPSSPRDAIQRPPSSQVDSSETSGQTDANGNPIIQEPLRAHSEDEIQRSSDGESSIPPRNEPETTDVPSRGGTHDEDTAANIENARSLPATPAITDDITAAIQRAEQSNATDTTSYKPYLPTGSDASRVAKSALDPHGNPIVVQRLPGTRSTDVPPTSTRGSRAARRITVSQPKPPSIQRLPDQPEVSTASSQPLDHDEDWPVMSTGVWPDFGGESSEAGSVHAPPVDTLQRAMDDAPSPEEPLTWQPPVPSTHTSGTLVPEYSMESPLPRQELDLGQALQQADLMVPSSEGVQEDSPQLVLMPPIGQTKVRPGSPPLAPPVQRTPASEPAPDSNLNTDSHMQRPPADDAALLTLLGLPSDTPVQRDGPAMPETIDGTIQRDVDASLLQSIQRAPAEETGAPTRTATDSATLGEEEDATDEADAIEKMAQKVYHILKRRLRIEVERERGRR